MYNNTTLEADKKTPPEARKKLSKSQGRVKLQRLTRIRRHTFMYHDICDEQTRSQEDKINKKMKCSSLFIMQLAFSDLHFLKDLNVAIT